MSFGMSARLAKDIGIAHESKDFDFVWDEDAHIGYIQFVGPKDSPYEGQLHILEMKFWTQTGSKIYPMKPPIVTFKTPMFHPNVRNGGGAICLDILQNRWTPLMSIEAVFQTIIGLLDDPGVDSPLNGTAASQYPKEKDKKHNIVKYKLDTDAYNKLCEDYYNKKLSGFKPIFDKVSKLIQEKQEQK